MAAAAIAFLLFFALGLLIAISGGIIGTVDAFQVSLVWGLLYLFIPFASLVFTVKFWSRKWARNSFLMAVSGSGIAVIMAVLLAATMPVLLEDADLASSYETDIYGDPIVSESVAAQEVSAAPEPTPAEVGPEANFRDAVNLAMDASQQTQSASTKADWAAVAVTWQQSIDLMKAVPSSDPNYETAQTKVAEYSQNLAYAQQNAL